MIIPITLPVFSTLRGNKNHGQGWVSSVSMNGHDPLPMPLFFPKLVSSLSISAVTLGGDVGATVIA
jgi:hypothetical protein